MLVEFMCFQHHLFLILSCGSSQITLWNALSIPVEMAIIVLVVVVIFITMTFPSTSMWIKKSDIVLLPNTFQ